MPEIPRREELFRVDLYLHCPEHRVDHMSYTLGLAHFVRRVYREVTLFCATCGCWAACPHLRITIVIIARQV